MRCLHRAHRREGGAFLRHADQRGREKRDHDDRRHRLTRQTALQRAFIEEQAAQCGYCINGMIMSAKELLDRNPRPSEADVRAALADNLCRCGTHARIIRAVLRAAQASGRT
jgi:aerobic-type carbon monoxide dehydrogenase small subunit (CoxS/CutS family)